jgi:hypothetical protein
VTLAGLALASNFSGRPEPELLAQAVDGVLPVWRDGNGGFYFDQADLTALPRRATCAVKGCGRPRHVSNLCLCSTCYKRYRRGADLTDRIHTEKARGAAYIPRSGREPTPVAERCEQAWGDILERHPHRIRRLVRLGSYEDRQAEQLGDPEMWQAVADEALERAWYDLTSGAYEARLAGRLAALRPPKPKTIQSPLVASVRGIS